MNKFDITPFARMRTSSSGDISVDAGGEVDRQLRRASSSSSSATAPAAGTLPQLSPSLRRPESPVQSPKSPNRKGKKPSKKKRAAKGNDGDAPPTASWKVDDDDDDGNDGQEGSLNRKDLERLERERKPTSMKLFRRFIVELPDGSLDASRIHSRECYDAWLVSRKVASFEPEKSFQRSLSSHLTSVDGRMPFTEKEELAVLEVLRRKERWPCFADSSVRFGQAGFRAKGFHEKRILQRQADANPADRRAAGKRQQLHTGPINNIDVADRRERRVSRRVKRRKTYNEEAEDEEEFHEERHARMEDGDDAGYSEDILETTGQNNSMGSPLRDDIKSLMDQLIDPDEFVPPSSLSSMRMMTTTTTTTTTSFDDVHHHPHVKPSHQSTTALHAPLPAAAAGLFTTSSSSSSSLHHQVVEQRHTVAMGVDNDPTPGGRFLALTHSLFGNLAMLSTEAWKKLLTIARMVLFSTGSFHTPTMEEAQQVMRQVTSVHPEDAILLMDLTVSDLVDRFILQNAQSRRFIGAVSRSDGGFQNRIFDRKDTWQILKSTLSAFKNPGIEMPVHVHLLCLGNIMLPFGGFISVDPRTKLIVLRGLPAAMGPDN